MHLPPKLTQRAPGNLLLVDACGGVFTKQLEASVCLLACTRGSSGCGDGSYQTNETSGVLYAIKFVEGARKQANEKTVLFVSAGCYQSKGFTTGKIPLFDPTFEESQPSAAGHFGEFKQIV